MFDIGFFELVLLSVVALVVLGPEKLPGAIRTISLWVGRLRRSFNTIKQDIEREIGADEIRRQLRNEAIMDKFKETRKHVDDAVNAVKKDTEAFRKNIELESSAAAMTNSDEVTAASNSSAATGETGPTDQQDSSASAADTGTGEAAEPTTSKAPTPPTADS